MRAFISGVGGGTDVDCVCLGEQGAGCEINKP